MSFKGFLEWYFGIPPADPGQGTAWHFDWRTPWPEGFAPWLLAILAVMGLFYVVWTYRQDAPALPRFSRLALVLLRIASLALVLFFLTQVTLTIDRTGLPYLAILIDTSASMGLEDDYAEKKEGIGGNDQTRLGLAKQIMTNDNGDFLQRVSSGHKLRIYEFAQTARPLANDDAGAEQDLSILANAISGLSADGEQTSPGAAVRQILEDFRGSLPTAIILFTDGITTTGDRDKLTAAAPVARSKLVPVYTVALGNEEPARDLQLYDLLADEVAFVDDPITFTAKLRAFGYEGEQVRIELLRRQSGRDEKPKVVASRTIKTDVGKPTQLELAYKCDDEGDYEFRLRAVELPRETNPRNNEETRAVSVRREKIQVLLADSLPRYEFRYLKHLLEREPSVELKTILQDADLDYANEDATALQHFPVKRDELFEFDVVIFGDLDPTLSSERVFENLREFVRDGGGGVIFVAGTQHNPVAYRNSPLAAMFPIELDDLTLPAENISIRESFLPSLTLEGTKATTIFRFAETETESQKIWDSLPGFYWMVEAQDLKPGAIVLAEHPAKRGKEKKLPVIAMQRYGSGKVIFHASDELWRWRFRAGDLHYGRYWNQAIRYLTRSRLLGRTRSAELTSDRRVYRRGDNIYLRARFLDQRTIPAEDDGVTVMIERQASAAIPVKLVRQREVSNVFEGQLSRATEGSYHAWIATPAFKNAPPSADFRVESPMWELQKRSLDRAELVQTAKLTHGRAYSPSDVAELPDDLPRGKPVSLNSEEPIPLWNRWELLTLFAVVLLAEWLLRKRYRLI